MGFNLENFIYAVLTLALGFLVYKGIQWIRFTSYAAKRGVPIGMFDELFEGYTVFIIKHDGRRAVRNFTPCTNSETFLHYLTTVKAKYIIVQATIRSGDKVYKFGTNAEDFVVKLKMSIAVDNVAEAVANK